MPARMSIQSKSSWTPPRPPEVYWLRQEQADVPPGIDWLSVAEADVLQGMRFPKRQADWRLGRWTAKRILATYLQHQGALSEIEVRPNESGAPQVFLANQPVQVSISLSHAAGAAVCAAAPVGTALGCDLEYIEPRSEAFLADYFTAEEQVRVAGAAAEDRPLISTLLWSAKESALKALGVGLRLDTRSLAVRFAKEGPPTGEGREACISLPAYCAGTWYPLSVGGGNSKLFHGWWRHSGKFVLTVVADPAPGPPTVLS